LDTGVYFFGATRGNKMNKNGYQIMIKLFEEERINFWRVKKIAKALRKEGFPSTAKFMTEVATMMEDKNEPTKCNDDRRNR
jgi:hypothetical protein